MRTGKLSVGVNTAQGGAASITFEWGDRPYSKTMPPAAWKRVWEYFGGPDVSNDEIRRLVERWLCDTLQAADLDGDVLDVPWVNDHLPALNAA